MLDLPTPSTSHVNRDQVYDPAEDSYLLIQTLSSRSEGAFLQHRFSTSTQSPVVCEIGTGSGVVLAFVTANIRSILRRSDVTTIGVDVNPIACRATAETVRIASEQARERQLRPANFLGCFRRDLASGFHSRSLDVVIFNPPYVPTESLPDWRKTDAMKVATKHDQFQRDSHLLELSYAGGKDGMETTNRLLAQLPEVLSDCGVAYVLLCAQNRPSEIVARVRDWGREWRADIVDSSGMKAGWEKLFILRIWRHQGFDMIR